MKLVLWQDVSTAKVTGAETKHCRQHHSDSSDFLRFAAHLNEIVSHCTATEWIDQSNLNAIDLRAPEFDSNIV